MEAAAGQNFEHRSIFAYPWVQLVIGVTCMVMIANLQYGWTFFVPDIQKKFGWDRSSIQIAFTLFVLFETWLVPIEGWFVGQVRSARRDFLRRCPVCDRLDHEFLCRHAHRVLHRADHRRHRRRRGLRDLHRQRAEVVPRPARARSGHHRGRVRGGFGADRDPHPEHDQERAASKARFSISGLDRASSSASSRSSCSRRSPDKCR